MKNKLNLVMIALAGLSIVGCSKDERDYNDQPVQADVIIASGDSSAIAGKLVAFRELAGKSLNNSPGATGGRREINWDAVPADLLNKNTFPSDFFNATEKDAADGRKRGISFLPANTAFRVSDNNFADIDPALGSQFGAFSKSKTFSPIGSTITELMFTVPGTNTAAYVNSFGVIFSDVDNASATAVEVYEGNTLLGKVRPTAADKKFSFVGIHTKGHKITNVKIITGNKAISAGVTDGTTSDMVIMDDLIYSEPRPYSSN
ncbi:hypothetical protein GCM10023149_29490 [Mucilaginibacter gynuensis]|uniref:Fimbrillin family protein n=1 Tax=Mucilaginibacter gynuensis TaxID=1302236 RepID=A0ABP8GLR7_9SPHI